MKRFYKILAPVLIIAIGTTYFGYLPKAQASFSGFNIFVTATGNETAQTSTIWTILSATAASDAIAVFSVAIDNKSTADGNTSDVTSVTDSKGNTWLKAGEFTNTVGGAANDGATIAVWYTLITNQLLDTDTITSNYSASVTAKAAVAFYLNIATGNTLSVAASSTLVNDNADAGSMTLSGLTSKEYLFVRAVASETDTQAITATANYSAISQAARSGTGGSEKGHMSYGSEFRVLTGTGDTSDPTMSDTTADRASLYVAFQEVPPATSPPASTSSIVSVWRGSLTIKGPVTIK